MNDRRDARRAARAGSQVYGAQVQKGTGAMLNQIISFGRFVCTTILYLDLRQCPPCYFFQGVKSLKTLPVI